MQDTLTMGTILPLGITFAPRNTYPCDGRVLAIADETALYSLMGDAFGGDGRATFGLPDLRGRAAVGTGPGPGLVELGLGQRIGSQTQTLAVEQMPSHSHQAAIAITSASAEVSVQSTLYVNGGKGNSSTAEGNYLATATAGLAAVTNDYADSADSSLNGGTIRSSAELGDLQIQGSVAVGRSGGSQPFSIQSPVQAVTYVILGGYAGEYPRRS